MPSEEAHSASGYYTADSGKSSLVLYYYKVSTGGQQSAGAAPFFTLSLSVLKTTKEPSEKAL